ncbi:nitrile hydratase subunit alpha [bacterium]|nr:nitrile hydratase subunit alpha [bacterium]MCI0605952.1 nitrile hydratase subunit alpha [bacterium]
MSPAFEAFLARLYVDPEFRARFLKDRTREAYDVGLSHSEIAALLVIPQEDLEIAASSFEKKRRRMMVSKSTLASRLMRLFR